MLRMTTTVDGHPVLHRLLAVLSTLVLLSALAPPAAAAPADPTSPSPDVLVQRVDGRWQVTWRPDRPVPVRDDIPVLLADGRRVGVARPTADGTGWTATTDDARVNRARTVTLGWATDAATPSRRSAPDTRAGWGAEQQGPVLAHDPAAPGRYRVDTLDYDLGDDALAIDSLAGRVELRGRVYVPANARGRRPVVLFLHGMHLACYVEGDNGGGGGGHLADGESAWPCAPEAKPVPSYLGYEGYARVLASRGYVVASVSANGVNAWGQLADDLGQQARADLTLASLDLLRAGDRGTGALRSLQGRLDLQRVGLMGHSRGGEGVARAALDNTRRAHPYGIRSLFLIAPTDFFRLTLPDVATAVELPYCDGDVGDLQGQHYLDDTDTTTRADRGLRSSVLVLGANHNHFNTVWTAGSVSPAAGDDWGGDPAAVCGAEHPDRLTAAEQYAAGTAYLAGFFRATLGGEEEFLPLFDGSGTRAASAGRAVVRTTFTGPSSSRRVLASFSRTAAAATVTGGARLSICAGMQPVNPDPELVDPSPTTDGRHPACTDRLNLSQAAHWGWSPYVGQPAGTAVGRLRWTDRTGRVAVRVRARDVRRYDALSLRMAPDPAAPTSTSPGRLDLTLAVVDGRGRRASVPVSAVSDALHVLPGRDDIVLPRTQLRTVRVPLTRLRGVDLRDLRRVELVTDRTTTGSVYVSDLALVRTETGRPAPSRLPTVRLLGRPAVVEGPAGTTARARFTVELSRPSRRPVTVELSSAPWAFSDEIAARGALVVIPRATTRVRIPAGRTRVTATAPVVGNDRYGPDQVMTAGLTRPSGAVLGTNSGYADVTDDDSAPTLQLGPAAAAEAAGVVRFPVTLSAASDRTTFLIALARPGTAGRGADWEAGDDPSSEPYVLVEIPPGQRVGWAEVNLVDDQVAEPTETFTLTVQEVGNATASGPSTVTGTITDDDGGAGG